MVLLTALVLMVPTTPLVYADSSSEYEKSVRKIAKEIKQISRNINANKAVLKNEQDKLFEAEQALSDLAKKMAQTDQQLNQQNQHINHLSEQIASAKVEQKKNQQALAQLIESRYKNGDQQYLKRLLNQENPYQVGRLSHYHGFFSQAVREKLVVTQRELETVIALQKEHKAALVELNQTREQQEQQENQLKEIKKTRASSVAKLSKKVTSSSKKLKQLQQDRDRLNTLLKKIAKQKEELRRLEEQRRKEQAKQQKQSKKGKKKVKRKPVKGGFVKQKGRLNYPVQGDRKRNFGSRLAESGMKSEGVFIATKGGVPVKSIFRGRVLFAEFLKGYGLLLIIDHGDDHISLYGHNELLYKKVGDSVSTNEIVAKTGVTGGLKSTGLYFEIRQNATPVNPDKWCQ